MSTQVFGLTAIITASTDNEASMDIPEDGEITGVDWTLLGDTGFASDDLIRMELSFVSTNQLSANDRRGPLSHCCISAGTVTTSGVSSPFANKFVQFNPGIAVAGGERIFLHSSLVGAATAVVDCDVHFDSKRAAAPRRAARRR
jgi:hypothetical protein